MAKRSRQSMHSSTTLAVLVLLLAGCRGTPTAVTATATPGRVEPAATQSPTATPRPAVTTPTPAPNVATLPPPTATAIADGIIVRLGTPDPRPECPLHYPWFFDNPAVECASYLENTWAVMQRFEHGLMIWFQNGGQTYVLGDDGSPFKPYAEAIDGQGLPLPGPDPSLVPPPGLFQPELGFANFWRGLVPGYAWVRERLGWAVEAEVAYSAFRQCNQSAGDGARCYFTGPRDEIVVMARGSAQYWAYWQGPVR